MQLHVTEWVWDFKTTDVNFSSKVVTSIGFKSCKSTNQTVLVQLKYNQTLKVKLVMYVLGFKWRLNIYQYTGNQAVEAKELQMELTNA